MHKWLVYLMSVLCGVAIIASVALQLSYKTDFDLLCSPTLLAPFVNRGEHGGD